MDRLKCVIAVPIYKEKFDFDEYNSVKQLFKILPIEKYDIIAFGPQSLDRTYYYENFNFANHYYFWDEYFINFPFGYNSLMLNSGFYELFNEYEYMLVYHPDAWVFRDELEYWCNEGYDYIGSPCMFYGNKLYLHNNLLMNGGFSLRKIKFWIELCTNYQELISNIIAVINEDNLINYILEHNIKLNVKLPIISEAVKFSFEAQPETLYITNSFKLPFGCHGYNKIFHTYFWDEFICYNKKSYSIVTYIFGKNDVLKDPDEVDENVEYICITDRDDLESNVWTIKKLDYPNANQYNVTQKTIIARYTALDYISTEYCVKIDPSVHIKKSISSFINSIKCFYGFQAAFLSNNLKDNYLDEYDELIRTSKLDPIQKNNFIKFCNDHHYDINSKGIISTEFMLIKNNEKNKNDDHYILNELINNFNFSVSIDYPYFSIIEANLLNVSEYKYQDLLGDSHVLLSPQILQSEYMESNKIKTNLSYNFEKEEIRYFNDNKYICYYLI